MPRSYDLGELLGYLRGGMEPDQFLWDCTNEEGIDIDDAMDAATVADCEIYELCDDEIYELVDGVWVSIYSVRYS